MRVDPGRRDGGSTPAVPRSVWRIREIAICVGLTAIAFLQQPGRIVADSKIDLAVNPVGWLERSLHLWDPANAFGQLQNQAYGYLWPIGPFFAAGAGLQIPTWAVQRLWWALLFCVAFTGVVRLANRLDIGTPAARLIAATAFALSPRILTELGSLSVEAWPGAVAPWVLVPLIGLARGARMRRAVALSGLAVACAGGVNATATLAVLPLAVLWLLSLSPARRRFACLGAWSLAVLAATAWWLVPLAVLGRYSPPFLDYIETSAATTGITDSVSILRGASQWVAYLGSPFGAVLPAGARLADEPLLIVATVVVAALGLAGLSRRGMPHRGFLVTGLVLGLALVGLGHVSDLPGTFAADQQHFLDGIGAPLRNVHKFDVLLRLPLALGLAHLLGVLARWGAVVRRGFRYSPAPAAIVTVVSLAAIGVAAIPAFAGDLAPTGGFQAVPTYWRTAAHWLDANAPQQRILVVPGARFATYIWGRTVDEITQPLLSGPSAVRNAVPLTPPDTIRLLDSIGSTLSTGAGSAGLADVLARSGVSYVLLRSDLDYGRSGASEPIVVEQALRRSPGLSMVASFGPLLGSPATLRGYTDHGLGIEARALEVFRVDRPVSPAVAYDLGDVTTVVGGPEALVDLAAAQQLTDAPAIMAGDLPTGTAPGRVAITDTMRRRDVAFGADRDTTSATLTAAEAEDGGAHDYLPRWGTTLATTVRYEGVRDIGVSSSAAQAGASGGSRPEYQPYAAFDGDLGTAWRPLPGTPNIGQWIEVDLNGPTTVSAVQVSFDVSSGALPTKVTVDAGLERATVRTFGSGVSIALPGIHATRSVRLTVEQVLVNRPGASFGIAEMAIPGVHVRRTLAVPAAPASGQPATVVVTAAPSMPACFFSLAEPHCSPAVARASEDGNQIDRTITLATAGTYRPAVWATPRPGPALNEVLDRESAAENALKLAPAISASTTEVDEPAGRAGAVLDGDPATAWFPSAADANPMLRLTFVTPRTVTGVQVTLDRSVAATRPGVIRVVGDDGMAWGFLNPDGVLIFGKPMHTDNLSIFLANGPTARSYDSYTTKTEVLPVAVGEVTILPGVPKRRLDLDTVVALPCGSGPTLYAGWAQFRTRLVATRRDLLELRETPAEPCGDRGAATTVPLLAGELPVVAAPSGLAVPVRAALLPTGTAALPTASPVQVQSWSVVERHLTVPGRLTQRLLAVRENANPGWQATAGGQVLTPIVVDGWQQGWLIPSGYAGEIVLRFLPDVPYRIGLLGGAAAVLILVVLALVPARPRGAHAPRPAVSRRGIGPAVPFIVGGMALTAVGGLVGAVVVLAGLLMATYRATVPRRGRGRRLGSIELWLPSGLLLLGGWWTVAMDDSHRAAAPQLAGLLAVGGVWLSVCVPRGRQRALRPAPTPDLQGLLNGVVTYRRDQQPAGHRQKEHLQRVPAERRPENLVDGLHHGGMPEEQPVRHGADPPDHRVTQEHVQ